MAPPLSKRLKRSVRSAVIVAAIRLLSHVPRRIAWAIATLAGRLAWPLAGKTRRLALEHLAIAFPEKTAGEREAIARAMFLHLAHAAAEVVTIASYDAELESYVGLENRELLERALAAGKGLIIVPGHIGNWELLARRLGRTIGFTTVAKASNDPRLTELIDEFRSSGQVTSIWRGSTGAGRAIITTLRAGKVLSMLIDQDTRVQNVFVPFFGRLAATPRAVGDLALRFGAPIFVGTNHRRGKGPGAGHVVEVTEVPYDSNPSDREAEVVRITAACTRVYEEAIRRHPEEWVWMHERWKTRQPSSTS